MKRIEAYEKLNAKSEEYQKAFSALNRLKEEVMQAELILYEAQQEFESAYEELLLIK